MTRRHHGRLFMKRRQLGPLFAADDSSLKSDPLGSTSPANVAAAPPQSLPAGDSSTSNAGATGDTGNNPNDGTSSDVPDAPPIGKPNEHNPVSPTSPTVNSPTQPTGLSIPSVDPSPPKGANPSQQSSAAPSSSSNAPSSTSAVSSASSSSAVSTPTSSASLSNPASLVASQTPSTPAVVAAPVHTALSSSTPLALNSLNPAATSLIGPHSTISGLIPTQTGAPSAASTSSISTPAIVGIAAGGLCGLAILGAACLWIGKRVSRYMETRDLEPPPMHELVADEDPAIISRRLSGPTSGPRPPTMIERRQANLAGRGNGFYNDDNNGFNPQNNFPPYAVDPRFGNATPFAPGQYYPAAPAPAAQPFFNPIATPSPFDDSAAAIPSSPGTPVYFSRQNSMQSGFGTTPGSNDTEAQLPNPYDAPVTRTNDGYATLNRGSSPATPQRPYADLARQLTFSSATDRTTSPAPSTGSYATVPLVPHNTGISSSPRSPSFKAVPMSPSVVNVPSSLHESRAAPVQFGFTTPATSSVPAALTPARGSVRSSIQPAIPASHSASSQSSRPETVYDEEDAYAAI